MMKATVGCVLLFLFFNLSLCDVWQESFQIGDENVALPVVDDLKIEPKYQYANKYVKTGQDHDTSLHPTEDEFLDEIQWERDDFLTDEIDELEDLDELDQFEFDDDDGIFDHLDSDKTIPEEEPIILPSDVYSKEYVESLQKIGIEKIASKARGITYSFYTDQGFCKNPSDIERDLQLLKDFELIRIYDTDCDGVKIILSNLQPHQKVFAGIYYLENLSTSINILNDAIQQVNQGDWSKIHTISIGNELVNFGKATPTEIKNSLVEARTILNGFGYHGPVVTTDTLVAMLNNKELCFISDYIAVNSHPYWDGRVKPQEAGGWLSEQLQMLNDVCLNNGKEILLAETGWPTQGLKFGEFGIPSRENQLIAIKSIVDVLGPKVILFTTFNDYWKNDGSHGVEKFWGLFDG